MAGFLRWKSKSDKALEKPSAKVVTNPLPLGARPDPGPSRPHPPRLPPDSAYNKEQRKDDPQAMSTRLKRVDAAPPPRKISTPDRPPTARNTLIRRSSNLPTSSPLPSIPHNVPPSSFNAPLTMSDEYGHLAAYVSSGKRSSTQSLHSQASHHHLPQTTSEHLARNPSVQGNGQPQRRTSAAYGSVQSHPQLYVGGSYGTKPGQAVSVRHSLVPGPPPTAPNNPQQWQSRTPQRAPSAPSQQPHHQPSLQTLQQRVPYNPPYPNPVSAPSRNYVQQQVGPPNGHGNPALAASRRSVRQSVVPTTLASPSVPPPTTPTPMMARTPDTRQSVAPHPHQPNIQMMANRSAVPAARRPSMTESQQAPLVPPKVPGKPLIFTAMATVSDPSAMSPSRGFSSRHDSPSHNGHGYPTPDASPSQMRTPQRIVPARNAPMGATPPRRPMHQNSTSPQHRTTVSPVSPDTTSRRLGSPVRAPSDVSINAPSSVTVRSPAHTPDMLRSPSNASARTLSLASEYADTAESLDTPRTAEFFARVQQETALFSYTSLARASSHATLPKGARPPSMHLGHLETFNPYEAVSAGDDAVSYPTPPTDQQPSTFSASPEPVTSEENGHARSGNTGLLHRIGSNNSTHFRPDILRRNASRDELLEHSDSKEKPRSRDESHRSIFSAMRPKSPSKAARSGSRESKRSRKGSFSDMLTSRASPSKQSSRESSDKDEEGTVTSSPRYRPPSNAILPLGEDPFARVEGVRMMSPEEDHAMRLRTDSMRSRRSAMGVAGDATPFEPPRPPPKDASFTVDVVPNEGVQSSSPRQAPPSPEQYKTARNARRGHALERVPPEALPERPGRAIYMKPSEILDREVAQRIDRYHSSIPFPLTEFLMNSALLSALIAFLSFSEWCVLVSVSKRIREAFYPSTSKHANELNHRALCEEVLERYLKTVGYIRWLWSSDEKDVPGSGGEPLVLSLRDLNDYMRGVSMPTHQYARVAESYNQAQKQPSRERNAALIQEVRSLAAATRAYTRVVLRLRAQAERQATASRLMSATNSPTQSTFSHGTSQLGHSGRQPMPPFQSPLFRPRRAPLLRVFVPSPEGDWLADASVIECEAELRRAGVMDLFRMGDVVWDVAVGDEGNVGRLIWDGSYLLDLDYTYSSIGDLPKYIPALSFSPSYFHRIIRTGPTSSNPIVHMDISPWGEEIASNLQLLQDRARTETPQGAHHNVVRWVHRSSFKLKPKAITSTRNSVHPVARAAGTSPRHERIPVPGFQGVFVDSGWYGTIVVEAEGTNEGLADLQDRCGPGVFPARATGSSALHSTVKGVNFEDKAAEARKVFRIMREKSRPGEIWLHAVSAKDRIL